MPLSPQHRLRVVWNLSYDKTMRQGQYVRAADYYKMEFLAGETGGISIILWRHDRSVPDGELLCKLEETST